MKERFLSQFGEDDARTVSEYTRQIKQLLEGSIAPVAARDFVSVSDRCEQPAEKQSDHELTRYSKCRPHRAAPGLRIGCIITASLGTVQTFREIPKPVFAWRDHLDLFTCGLRRMGLADFAMGYTCPMRRHPRPIIRAIAGRTIEGRSGRVKNP